MSEYEEVSRGALKLKGDFGIKKKKKKKDKQKLLEQVTKVAEVPPRSSEKREEEKQIVKTKAELAFQKMQEKMQKERIMQKASKTHKQRVEEFNKHLDGLTEHFDIPKVSWTK